MGVGAFVSISNNTVEAYLGKNAVVVCSGDVLVDAIGRRDVQAYVATIAGSGGASVGVSVLVSVVGGKLDQDSADAIRGQKKSTDSTETVTYFNPSSFMSDLGAALVDNVGTDTSAGML